MFTKSFAGLIAGSMLVMPAAHAATMLPFDVSLESETAGLQNSTSKFHIVGVENFNSRATGTGRTFTTDFGMPGVFNGTYTNVQINAADQYGGAGGTGRYAVTFTTAGYTLDLSTTAPGGVTYFGYWLSALDGGNNVTFYSKGKQLFTFSAAQARNFAASLPNASQYRCNPNPQFAGRNCNEPYMFLNFYAKPGLSFDKIVFSEVPASGGYESDNHTVGRWRVKSGTLIPGAGSGIAVVPEPATWAMMIAGFGLVGASLRRRSVRHVTA